jgi:hypothetical protein
VPNPSLNLPAQLPEQQVEPAANGVLAWVGGDRIAQAALLLPPTGPEQAARRELVVPEPRFGAVRITYELVWHRHGRSRFWSWRAVRADPVMVGLQVVEFPRWVNDLGPG